MLPRTAYLDPAVFAWEQRAFFGSGWACVGFSSQLARPGDQRAERVGGDGVLLVRGGDGVLRAFATTCSGTAGFDPARWGLAELAAAEWHGLIFVNSSGQAGPLADALAGLDEIIAPYEPARLVIAGRRDYDAAANWKIVTENYEECYHCPSIHPELCKVTPPNSGTSFPGSGRGPWVGGWMRLRDGMRTMSLDGGSLGVPLRGLDEQGQRIVTYLSIFPNVLLSLHPDYVMTHRLVPLAVDRTFIECSWAFAPEALDRPGFDPEYAVKFWDITNLQDFGACESVQRGLGSEHSRPGPIALAEDGVHDFVALVARGYQGESVWARPAGPAAAAG
jgi:glycine betaine catabolism A